MTGTISSRTPEGVPNHCPICGKSVCIEPSHPPGDAPCPNCGTLLWFVNTSTGIRFYESKAIAPLRERILRAVSKSLGVGTSLVPNDLGGDSLDIVELVMELEDEFGISIPEEDAGTIKTVGDAIDYFEKRQL
jgi:acyl carrier protein